MASATRETRSNDQIDIVGLRDFQRELRAIDKTMPRELRVANKKAAETVKGAALRNFMRQPGPGPAVGKGMKIQAQQREASVIFGTAAVRKGTAILLGPEFGGSSDPKFKTARGGHTHQFPPHAGRQGLAFYPALRSKRQDVIDVYGDMIHDVAKAAFPD